MIKTDWMKKAARDIIDMLHEREMKDIEEWDVEEAIWWAYKYRKEVE